MLRWLYITMNRYRTDKGKVLVDMIKSDQITKDILNDYDCVFHGAYEQLHYDNFRLYLGSVSRYLQNKRLELIDYNGN